MVFFFLVVTHRLEKEVRHYQNELKENEAEWKRVVADPTKDEYDAKRYRDIWEESVRMVPDAERRYQVALQDLSTHVLQHFANDNATDDNNNEWLVVARQILEKYQLTTAASEKKAVGGVGGDTTNVDDLAEGEAF